MCKIMDRFGKRIFLQCSIKKKTNNDNGINLKKSNKDVLNLGFKNRIIISMQNHQIKENKK